VADVDSRAPGCRFERDRDVGVCAADVPPETDKRVGLVAEQRVAAGLPVGGLEDVRAPEVVRTRVDVNAIRAAPVPGRSGSIRGRIDA
jgi:hypothetical protein